MAHNKINYIIIYKCHILDKSLNSFAPIVASWMWWSLLSAKNSSPNAYRWSDKNIELKNSFYTHKYKPQQIVCVCARVCGLVFTRSPICKPNVTGAIHIKCIGHINLTQCIFCQTIPPSGFVSHVSSIHTHFSIHIFLNANVMCDNEWSAQVDAHNQHL